MRRLSPRLGFGIAISIMIAVGVFAAASLQGLMQADESVVRAQRVLHTMESILSQLKDAQTAQRGYVITGNPRYLEPYESAIDPSLGVRAQLDSLKRQLKTHAEQRQRLEKLEQLADTQLAIVNQIIALRRDSGFAPAQRAVMTDRGKLVLDDIRRLVVDMKATENWELQRESEASAVSARKTVFVLTAGGVLAVAMLFGAFALVMRAARIRQLAVEELARLNRELDDRVRERTADLADAKQLIATKLDQLKTLRAIDKAILSSTDLSVVLKTVLSETRDRLATDFASVLLYNPHTLTLRVAASVGLRTQAAEMFSSRLGDGIAGNCALERRTIAVPNVKDIPFSRSAKTTAVTAGEEIEAIYAIPLIAKGQLMGVLATGFRKQFHADDAWLEFAEALAGQAAMAVESVQSFAELQRSNTTLALAYDTTIEGWARALDLRDKETEGHSRRVTDMTLDLARLWGMSDEELVYVRWGALLHDIGKMGIPDGILLKPGKLTDEEWDIMRKHPTFAYELLSPIAHLRPALDIPYCHHEKWDGTGYPRGLRGEQIPLSARLFAVVDVWDALRSDRPYRPAWTVDRVREHIRELSGSHFDARVVELFLQGRIGEGSATPPAAESLLDSDEPVPSTL